MRNTPETRFARVNQAGEDLQALLAPPELGESFPDLARWHEELAALQKSLSTQQSHSDFALVVFAGSSGGGKSTLLNALARSNLVETGTARPTTKEIRAFTHPEADISTRREYTGLADLRAVDSEDAGAFPEWLVAVEVPDRRLFQEENPRFAAKIEEILDLADVTVWVTDPQKYADADFLADLRRWGNPQGSVVVLTHTEALAADSLDAVMKDLQTALEKSGIGLPVMNATVFDESTVAAFREKILEMATLPESRFRAMNFRLQKVAQTIAREAAVSPEVEVETQGAEEKFCGQVAQACAVEETEEQLQKSYLRASRPFMMPPPLTWLAGAQPLTESPQFLPPKTNTAEVNLAARHFVDAVGEKYPQNWNSFFHRRAAHHAASLISALDLALASWEGPRLENKLWWRLWRAWQWIILFALVATSIWALIWLVSFLGGAPIPGLLGPVPLPPLSFGLALVVVVVSMLLGLKISGSRAKKFGETGAQKFRQLLDEVSRKAFLAPLHQEMTLYPQVSELTAQMGGI